ncbi:MAG: alpha/beta hydrolase domain-containing protein, partial [Actinomycetota bacterium]
MSRSRKSMSNIGRGAVGLLLLVTMCLVSPVTALGDTSSAAPTAATAVPVVTGPLAVTADSYPFGAADHTMVPQNLKKLGYVEEEYLVSGTANVYTWPAPGPAVVRSYGSSAPYTTRMLVRRPANGARFSGNVIVELLNPSNAFDLNIGWAMMHRQMVAKGDAWVGITAKPISVAALKNFDPVRYESLSMANPLPLDDPMNCANPVGSVTPPSRETEDGLVWDIYTQVGAWVRSTDPSNPLTYGGARGHSHHKGVQHVYGFGYSQTGGFQYNYINAIQPLVVQEYGKPMFDGYIVAVAGGAFVGLVPINQCEAAPPVGDPRRQFSNAGTPIIHVMSQSDYLWGIASRRPDGDTFPDLFRHYEMAGAGHATPDELYYAAAPADITKAGRAVPPMNCNEGPRSRFPSWMFFDAMLANLQKWVERGIAPPHVAPITVVSGAPVLDEFGNVTGGLRSPYLDVPTSTWYGSSTGASFCFIAGHETPFTEEQLAALYSSHGAYVVAVTKSVLGLVHDRIITAFDGVGIVIEAAKADVP